MENEELKYTESDLEASHKTGLQLWLETNAFKLFLFFGLGFATGFLLCLAAVARAACGA